MTGELGRGNGELGTGNGEQGLARKLTAFDATMIVMGGIIGSGIFRNPAEVAARVGTPALSTLAWALGGAVALVGAFVYAELAARRPQVGGQYAYLRDAFHPMVAFLYGWTLLLVVQTGGMAASALVFGSYARELTGLAAPEWAWASGMLMALTLINCVGVRAGSNVQSFFMILKLGVVAAVIAGALFVDRAASAEVAAARPSGGAMGVMTAMVPILFTYGGWQTASFVSGEMKNPRRDLARGLIFGVIGVVTVYLLVNTSFLAALGIGQLAASAAPASDVMRGAFGDRGARFIAAGVVLSTVGFLSQSMLTAPRVYYAMARDGLFFRKIGELGERSRVPVAAIALQGVTASVIAIIGRFEQVLNYVVSIDTLFFGLTAATLLVFRRRDREVPTFRVPLHPLSTILFVGACWAIALTTVFSAPRDAGGGVLILLLGVPIFLLWNRARTTR